MTSSAAYEAGYGQVRPQRVRQLGQVPPVRVVTGGRNKLDKVRKTLAAVRGVLVVAVVLGLIVSLLYSQATITELSGDLSKTQSSLTTAQSKYDYLSNEMSKITSRANIEEIAEGRLGLVKADPSQITYVKLEDQALIQKTSTNAAKLVEGFRTAALSLINNLDP